VLISPDESRRKAVVDALVVSNVAEITEITAFPTDLGTLPRLLSPQPDVVLIDLDSDPEFALEIVENICAFRSLNRHGLFPANRSQSRRPLHARRRSRVPQYPHRSRRPRCRPRTRLRPPSQCKHQENKWQALCLSRHQGRRWRHHPRLQLRHRHRSGVWSERPFSSTSACPSAMWPSTSASSLNTPPATPCAI
jgi:hypothetical protein